MKIKVTTTTTTEKEIHFPYITFYEGIQTYYYNFKENGCIVISNKEVSILENINFGLEHPEVKKEEVFKVMDQTILRITEALNK